MILFWILIWLSTAVGVWRLCRSISTRLSSATPIRARIASSLLLGVAISYSFAPGLLPAGMVAIPAPASFALWFLLLDGKLLHEGSLVEITSLVLVCLIAAVIAFIVQRQRPSTP